MHDGQRRSQVCEDTAKCKSPMGTREPGAANKTYTRPLYKRTRRSKAGGVRAARGRKSKAECEARVVREAWRQARAGGPNQESSSIAEQWVLKGGGLIPVDRGTRASLGGPQGARPAKGETARGEAREQGPRCGPRHDQGGPRGEESNEIFPFQKY